MPEKVAIQKVLKQLPKTPGIYKMIDEGGRVIYVGKAKDIKKRVRQYFQNNYQHSTRTRKLIENLANIEAIATDSELEAILLETNLIKQLQPKYNILMKDDKNYVYIKITQNEDFPRIQIVRKIEKDGAKYIGPKTAAHKVKETFKILKKIFPFRHCGLDLELLEERPAPEKHHVKVTRKVLKYPCLDYYIKRCIAPCIGACNIAEYRQIIKNAEDFLEGKTGDILKNLHQEMRTHAKNREFEKAARLRDKIKKVEDILEKQKISNPNRVDTDIINYTSRGDNVYFNLFQIRDGKLINQENFILSAREMADQSQTIEEEQKEILEAFLKQYYELATDIPKEILLPHETENNLESFLGQQAGKKIKIIIPQRGDKNKLLEMSLKNAEIYADRHKPSWQIESAGTEKAIQELQTTLKLTKTPTRIECYDISHLSGTNTVGSMIVFEKGVPKKDHYRKFQLRTVQNKPDDYKSMEEVLYRRFSKLAFENPYLDYKFKKAAKKHFSFIEKNSDIKFPVKDCQFYILEKDKKHIGFIAIKEHSKQVSEVTNLWLQKKQRGQKLGHKIVKEAIKKAKAPRVYGICEERLRDYYAMLGFEEIHKIPIELEKHFQECQSKCAKTIAMVYDKKKHKIDVSFTKTPDLVIIDGGKGQLSTAHKVLTELKLDIPHIALAKQLEEIFIPGKSNSIILPRNSEALKLLQRARDEAHRFAITYNRNLRSKFPKH